MKDIYYGEPYPGAQDFQPFYPYIKDTIIKYNGVVYRATTNFHSKNEFDPEVWERLFDAGEGINVISLTGAFLTRVVNGITDVQKSLFPSSAVFEVGKTLINDENGTLGVYIGDIDLSTIQIETKTISPIAGNEPVMLGEVNTFASLPLTIAGAESLFGITPNVGDYARIQADEEANGKTTERSISSIDFTNNITWGNPVFINTGDYQEQTTQAMAGQIPIAGATAGAWGGSISPDTFLSKSGGAMSGNLDMGENKIINSGSITINIAEGLKFTKGNGGFAQILTGAGQDVNTLYFEGADSVNFLNARLRGLNSPSLAGDAATKQYVDGAAIPNYSQAIPMGYSVINNNTANMRISLQISGTPLTRGYYHISFTAPSVPSSYNLHTFVRINGLTDILQETTFVSASSQGITLAVSKFFPIDLSKIIQLDIYVNTPYTWDLAARIEQPVFFPMVSN